MLLKKKRKQNPKWKKTPQKNKKNHEQTQPSLLISILYLYLKFH